MGVGRRMKKQGPPPDLGKQYRALAHADQNILPTAQGKKRHASGEVKAPQPTKRIDNGASEPLKNSRPSNRDVQSKVLRQKEHTIVAENGHIQNSTGIEIAGSHGNASKGIQSQESGDIENEEPEILSNGSEAVAEEESSSDMLKDEFLESESSVFDSDAEQEKARFSDDEDSDALEQLTAANIEGLSRKLDQTQEREMEEALLDMNETALQTNIDGDTVNIFEEADGQSTLLSKVAPDLQLLRSRISDTIRILENFKNLSDAGRSRADYTSQLLKDICLYYGYSPYLAEKLFNLFSPKEAFAFFEANETARPVVIRTNTLRTHRRQLAQALINRGVTLEPVGKWSKVGLQIFESQVPLGATPEYLAGHYILQAASSFLPVMTLAPQEHERILDMAAAPGGKTTYMAALMKNTGCIFANDSNKARAKGLIGNVHRLGVKNTIICNYDSREFPKVIGGFDRVLLDAPCSGTGVIAKDPSVKTNKTETDFMQLPHLQKQLLLSAIDSVDHNSKTGGYIVYSTCSVTVEENEQVVQYALRKRPNVQLVETGLVFGVDGFVSYMGKNFDPRMKMTKRYYPHAYNVDGFFVSKFKKLGPTIAGPGANAKMQHEGNGEETSLEDYSLLSTAAEETTDQDFGDFDDNEDEVYMQRSQRKRLRRKGIDPRSRNERKSIQ